MDTLLEQATPEEIARVVWPWAWGEHGDDEVRADYVQQVKDELAFAAGIPHWRIAALLAWTGDESNYEGGKWGDYGQVVLDASAVHEVLTGQPRQFELSPDFAGTNRELQAVAWDLEEKRREAVNAYEPLVKALQGIVDEPYGCAFCDYGVLRNPTKEHADDCSWVAARAALATVESSPEREGGE